MAKREFETTDRTGTRLGGAVGRFLALLCAAMRRWALFSAVGGGRGGVVTIGRGGGCGWCGAVGVVWGWGEVGKSEF